MMLPPFNTYRILVGRFLLGLYMFGALQSPILEVLHIASHVIIPHEHGGVHSIVNHIQNDDHKILSTVENGDSENNSEHQTFIKPICKAEILNVNTLSPFRTFDRLPVRVRFSHDYQEIMLDIPSPPPDSIC